MAESTYEYTDYNDDVDAILPDDFTIGDDSYSLEGTSEEAPTIESESEEQIESAEPEVEAEPEEPTITPEPAPQEVTEQEPVEQSSIETEIQEVAKPQTIKVKYNHEEREIGLDEAAILSQKGMNYDKLEQKAKDLESRISRAELLARRLGYNTPDEMYEAAENNFIETRVKDLVDAGNSEAIARFLVKQEMAEAANTVKQEEPAEEAPTPQEEPTSLMTPERRAELTEFVRAYPGITKLPEEVLKANAEGTRLLVAYERYVNKAALDKANSELAVLRQNQAAADKAPVTGLTGRSAADTQKQKIDPFLVGFDSDEY